MLRNVRRRVCRGRCFFNHRLNLETSNCYEVDSTFGKKGHWGLQIDKVDRRKIITSIVSGVSCAAIANARSISESIREIKEFGLALFSEASPLRLYMRRNNSGTPREGHTPEKRARSNGFHLRRSQPRLIGIGVTFDRLRRFSDQSLRWRIRWTERISKQQTEGPCGTH